MLSYQALLEPNGQRLSSVGVALRNCNYRAQFFPQGGINAIAESDYVLDFREPSQPTRSVLARCSVKGRVS